MQFCLLMKLPNLALSETQTQSDQRQENIDITDPQSATIQRLSTHVMSALALLKLLTLTALKKTDSLGGPPHERGVNVQIFYFGVNCFFNVPVAYCQSQCDVHGLHKYTLWTHESKVDLTCWVKGQRVSQDSKHSFTLVPVGPSIVAGPLWLLTQHL